MALFTMPDGSSGASDWTALLGLDGIGSGYDYAVTDSPPATSSTGMTLGDLQSGSTNFDWSSAFADTLGTLVAVDSINHGMSPYAGQGFYQGANGQILPIGSGGAIASSGLGSLVMLGVLVWVVLELAEGHK